MTTVAYIGLGSNQGDSLAILRSALSVLDQHTAIVVQLVSSFYRTKPVGPQNQPDYLNAVAQLETSLAAQDLLAELLAVEQQHGRVRDPHLRWGPRTLDLDLLLYGNEQIQVANLTVPHPELSKRAFVVYPLAEIAPHLALPSTGFTIQDYKQKLAADDLVRLDY